MAVGGVCRAQFGPTCYRVSCRRPILATTCPGQPSAYLWAYVAEIEGGAFDQRGSINWQGVCCTIGYWLQHKDDTQCHCATGAIGAMTLRIKGDQLIDEGDSPLEEFVRNNLHCKGALRWCTMAIHLKGRAEPIKIWINLHTWYGEREEQLTMHKGDWRRNKMTRLARN